MIMYRENNTADENRKIILTSCLNEKKNEKNTRIARENKNEYCQILNTYPSFFEIEIYKR